MRVRLTSAFALIMLATPGALAQKIVKVPAKEANVSRPDDVFALAPGHWHVAKQPTLGSETCLSDQCEAAFTSGDLVISVEHAKDFVRIIAGFRNCEGAAFSEVEVGSAAGKTAFRQVSKQLDRVVKGLGKTCKMTPPAVPKLEVARLFPKISG
jgi:hypothetical protein